MFNKISSIFVCLVLIGSLGCTTKTSEVENTNLSTDKTLDQNKNFQESSIDTNTFSIKKYVYVPIYSEIHVINAKTKCLLTATLSIRNTSRTDTMYVVRADYYDSKGLLRKVYVEKTLQMQPLESIEFVVEYNEKEGGVGANFIVKWGATKPSLNPIFQAVMVGSTSAQQGISFLTYGVTIE